MDNFNIQPINTEQFNDEKACRMNRKFYRKAHKKYIKELVKLVKEDGEFEWGYITDVLLLMLRRRLEYFDKGHNVWQAEECRTKAVETLREAIDKLTRAIESEWDFPEKPEGGWTDEVLAKYNEENQKMWDEAFLAISGNIRLWWD